MEEDLHMALCVVKVLALVVIAASLWSMSGSGSSYGLFSNNQFDASVISSANDPSSPTYLGPSRATEGSFSNRYEPPVFWNIGDINKFEEFQGAEVKNRKVYQDLADLEIAIASAKAASASLKGQALVDNMAQIARMESNLAALKADGKVNFGTFRGNFGLTVPPNKGYFGLTVPNRGYMEVPGIPTTSGNVSPY